MPYFVDKSGNVLESIENFTIEKISNFSAVYDSEYTTREKLSINTIQILIPELQPDYCLVYPEEQLTPSFSPWFSPLKDLGHSVDPLSNEELELLLNDIRVKFEDIEDEVRSPKLLRKAVESAIEEGYFDECLKDYSIDRQCLKYVREHKSSDILLNLPKVKIELKAFFADVDLFKSIGKEWQRFILQAPLESRRVLKAGSRNSLALNPTMIDGNLYEIELIFRDVMNRLPVLSGNGLGNQCKVYNAQIGKIDIKSEELAAKLGLRSREEIMANMDLLKALDPILFYAYGGIDPHATNSLDGKHQELMDSIRSEFRLLPVPIRDTGGSNVSAFIQDLTFKHFARSEDDLGIIKTQISLGNLKKLQEVEFNDFGIQTYRTVGGLLYSRMARCPYLQGYFGDLDEQSCYATKLSDINVYFGEPVTSTFKGKKYKPNIVETIKFLENNCPRDGWFIRVSGKLENAINTIVLSDLRFKPKREKSQTIWDKNPSKKHIGQFNAYKVSNKDAESVMLSKEIKFGLITADIWDVIKVLPDSWLAEFEALFVDAVVFIPHELVCHSMDELEEKRELYPDENSKEKFDFKTGLKTIELIYSNKNLCLAFPAKDYYEQLKQKRSAYKKVKNPIQEVFKLILNSTYGALACEHLPVNNLLAANIITASARATSWMMINALNGFQVITDGCTFSWLNIPLKTTFREVLESNPNYLIDYDPSINSGLDSNQITSDTAQNWIDENFKNHLYRFYGVDQNHIPANLYGFELKGEKFIEGKESFVFTEFANHGSGSYVKGLQGDRLLIEGAEYSLIDPAYCKVKARSFKGSDKNLLNWYVACLSDSYQEPIIYEENQIIKFGLGNDLAIKFLKDVDEIAHPMGFSRKVFKLMKLITRSQFLFKSQKQLRNFETNQEKLGAITNNIFNRKFWNGLEIADVASYGIEEIPDNGWYEYAKEHSLGLGFEVFTANKKHNGSVASVRNFIADKIESGVINFNSALNIDRAIDSDHICDQYRFLFAALLIKRYESEQKLKSLLINSKDEPTVLTVTKESVHRLEEILGYSE